MKTIKIDGNQYPVKMGYYALKHTKREIEAESDGPVDLLNELTTNIEHFEKILYHGLVCGWKREKKQGEFPLSRESMEMVVDEVGFDVIEELIAEAFPEKKDNKAGDGKPGK